MMPQFNWSWKCEDCGHEIFSIQNERQPTRPEKCPKCGSKNIADDGPIVHDMPLENPYVKY